MIGIKVYSSEGSHLIQKIVTDLKTDCEIVEISSVYRIWGDSYQPHHVHELKSFKSYDGLAVVLLISTGLTPQFLLAALIRIEQKYRSEVLRRSAGLNLLTFDDLAFMTPELTLPHPDLHLHPEALLLAAEVWGDYIHPVLGENLYTLTRRFRDQQWGRFYAQGKTLLDF